MKVDEKMGQRIAKRAAERVFVVDILLFILHKIWFAVSPIDRHRILANVEGEFQVNNVKRRSVDWLWVLRNPGKVMHLVERHHMVGRKWIYLLLVQLLIYVHLMVKFALHIMWSKRREQAPAWRAYYPDMASCMPNPALLNSLWLAFSLNSMVIRLRSLSSLLRGAILNQGHYTELSLTQINMAALASLSAFNLIQLGALIREGKSLIWPTADVDPPDLPDADLQLAQKTFDQLTLSAKLYYVNMLDFTQSYKQRHFELKPNLHKRAYLHWFVPSPKHRFGYFALCLVASNTLIGLLLVFSGSLCFYLFYLQFNFLHHLQHSGQEELLPAVFTWLLTPTKLINILEGALFVLLLVPFHLHLGYLLTDVIVLLSRIQRVLKLMKLELERAVHVYARYSVEPASKFHKNLPNCSEDTNCGPIRLNQRFCYYLDLLRLVYLEFVDARKAHTFYLNSLILGSGFSMSYGLMLLSLTSSVAEFFIIFTVLFSCIFPAIFVLISVSSVEQQVSNTHLCTN